ncbi:MAG: hypothetical protein KDD53_03730 [Bdellovibrionales bacterium]|nr:hypothetical protein [Bdellovibrionales bacterium]
MPRHSSHFLVQPKTKLIPLVTGFDESSGLRYFGLNVLTFLILYFIVPIFGQKRRDKLEGLASKYLSNWQWKIEGYGFEFQGVHLNYQLTVQDNDKNPLVISYLSSSKNAPARTHYFVPGQFNFQLKISTEDGLSKLGKFVGAVSDLHAGDKELDDLFVFQTNYELQAREFLHGPGLLRLLRLLKADPFFSYLEIVQSKDESANSIYQREFINVSFSTPGLHLIRTKSFENIEDELDFAINIIEELLNFQKRESCYTQPEQVSP